MKALVLAGGFPQIALIKELKKRGYTVVLADWNENPVAKSYADIFYQVSTLDIVAITEVAKKENVDFLITVCTDQALLTVAKVSEDLSLPCYIDYKTALNVTNKTYMKNVFLQNDIPTARYKIMPYLDEIQIMNLNYPLIVKPVDCNSSKGVKKVNNIEELKVAFNEAVGLSRTKTAIVEEFVAGSEMTVDIYVENGIANVLSVANSDKIADKDKFVIFRTRYPANELNDNLMALIKQTSQKIADAFGIENSPMLIQMITDGKEISVLEFSARTGGGVKHLLIKKVSGFDVISAVVDLTLGKKPVFCKKTPENKYIINEFIYCKPGVFNRLENFDLLKDNSVISDYYLFKWQGAKFDTVENSGDRVAGFTIQGDTFEELRKKHKICAKELSVIDINDNDIMRRDLLADL